MDEEEFFRKLSTLRSNTSLGDIVMIRSEKDKDVIKRFNTAQKNIYYSWKNRNDNKKKMTEEEVLQKHTFMKSLFKSMSK